MFISEELTKAYFGAKSIFSKQDKYRYEIDWGGAVMVDVTDMYQIIYLS